LYMALAFKKFSTPSEALAKLKKYCAYQERSHQQVRSKLLDLGLRGNDLENVMVKLIEEGFLNEERFAVAFAGGKFRIKHWGRKKIEQQLKAKGVSAYCIHLAMKEIDDHDYRKSLTQLLKKKALMLKEQNVFAKRQKLSGFLIGKGYEPEMVWEEVKNYFEE
jgi:regulatory protein